MKKNIFGLWLMLWASMLMFTSCFAPLDDVEMETPTPFGDYFQAHIENVQWIDEGKGKGHFEMELKIRDLHPSEKHYWQFYNFTLQNVVREDMGYLGDKCVYGRITSCIFDGEREDYNFKTNWFLGSREQTYFLVTDRCKYDDYALGGFLKMWFNHQDSDLSIRLETPVSLNPNNPDNPENPDNPDNPDNPSDPDTPVLSDNSEFSDFFDWKLENVHWTVEDGEDGTEMYLNMDMKLSNLYPEPLLYLDVHNFTIHYDIWTNQTGHFDTYGVYVLNEDTGIEELQDGQTFLGSYFMFYGQKRIVLHLRMNWYEECAIIGGMADFSMLFLIQDEQNERQWITLKSQVQIPEHTM